MTSLTGSYVIAGALVGCARNSPVTNCCTTGVGTTSRSTRRCPASSQWTRLTTRWPSATHLASATLPCTRVYVGVVHMVTHHILMTSPHRHRYSLSLKVACCCLFYFYLYTKNWSSVNQPWNKAFYSWIFCHSCGVRHYRVIVEFNAGRCAAASRGKSFPGLCLCHHVKNRKQRRVVEDMWSIVHKLTAISKPNKPSIISSENVFCDFRKSLPYVLHQLPSSL